MSNEGGSSPAREVIPQVPRDDEPRDIHVVREQLIQEDEPVTDPEEDSPEEMEEDDEEEDPGEFPPNSISAEIDDALYDRNI